MSHNYYSLHNFVDHKIVDRLALIEFWSHLVAFLEIWAHLVAFSVHYLNTLGTPINHLIDKSFNSHQEYTIATSLLAPARGTLKLLCRYLQGGLFIKVAQEVAQNRGYFLFFKFHFPITNTKILFFLDHLRDKYSAMELLYTLP